jgi:large subunit ribosomal protein L7/L12
VKPLVEAVCPQEVIQVIAQMRFLASLGLKKAKDLGDGAPKPVLEKVDKAAPWRLR